MGWELELPTRVVAEWNGKSGLEDIVIAVSNEWANDRLVCSHFGHGILTFRTGYLFRTDAGVGLWARGAPNWPKHGITPLDAVIETDWLTFTFTMNWQFTRPGRIVFEKDEPFCFITPIEYRALDSMEPEIVSIDEEPGLCASFRAWSDARRDFNRRLLEEDPDAVKLGWQKWYMRGEDSHGTKATAAHMSKLRVMTPQIKRSLGKASGDSAPIKQAKTHGRK
jgi:hypothetical protein